MGRLTNYIEKVKQAKKNIDKCNYITALKIPFDIRSWNIKYRLLESEYYLYRFFEKSNAQRLEYVRDEECMVDIPNKFNNSEEYKILDDKSKFNVAFQDCIGRDYLLMDGRTKYEEFCAFCQKYPVFMCKPLNNLGGFGVQKLSVSDGETERVWKELTEQGAWLLEEVLVQHAEMAALNPDTLNTIRVFSMVNDQGEVNVPLANVRIGRAGACVDNFCSGGMGARVDVNTGIVSTAAFNKKMETYSVHPDTQCPILGHQIPEWEKVVELVKSCAKRLPGLRYIGWDVAIKEDGTVCLVEGNHNAGSFIHQVAAGKGLRSVYETYLGKWN